MFTDSSEIANGTQHLYLKQSSLPVAVERDNYRMLPPSAVVHQQLSVDDPYGGRPKSQPKVASNTDSDASSCFSDRDGLTADGMGKAERWQQSNRLPVDDW